jgi:hypothetical protein
MSKHASFGAADPAEPRTSADALPGLTPQDHRAVRERRRSPKDARTSERDA